MALERHPAAVAARADVSRASAGVLENRGSWLPSLNVGSGFANSSNQRVDQSTGRVVSESYTASANTSLEVFDAGRRVAEGRAARARERAAEAAFREQAFGVRLTTTELFYAAAGAEELLESARRRLERAREQLRFAQNRLDVGSATRSDVLRAELEAANAEIAMEDALSEARRSRLELGRQVGREGEVQPRTGALPSEAPPLPPLADLLARLEVTAPAVVASREARAAEAASKWSAYSAYAPTVRLTGGLDWFSFDFPPRERSWSIRAIVSYPLFDGFRREAAVQRARASERAALARLNDARLGARVEVESRVQEIESQERRVAIAERAVELAREDLRVQEERYQIGAATILELQTSQTSLAEVEAAWVGERQSLGVAVARLEAVLGESLTENDGDE